MQHPLLCKKELLMLDGENTYCLVKATEEPHDLYQD
jgi:hypothetical protein